MQSMLHENGDARAIDNGPEATVALGFWLLLIYRRPAEPASARTTVWGETKRLSALSLQHAVCALPASDGSRSAFGLLARRVEEYGGEVMVLETTSPDAAWQDKIVGRFNAARDEEYEEVADAAERFREVVARERRKGKFTSA